MDALIHFLLDMNMRIEYFAYLTAKIKVMFFFYIEGKTNENECNGDPNKMIEDYNTLEIYKYGNDGALGCKEYQYIYVNGDERICFDKCEGSYYPSFRENNKCVGISTEQNCPNIYYNDITRGIKVCLQDNNCINQISYPYLIGNEKICNETRESHHTQSSYLQEYQQDTLTKRRQ